MEVVNVAELRIGNYVGIIVPACYRKVDWHVFRFIIDEGDRSYKSIPLTEEWLLRFGWIWNEDCKSYEKYPNGDARMHLAYRDINGSYTMFNYVLKATIAEQISYVHQLQNLYFALTGEELTIKE